MGEPLGLVKVPVLLLGAPQRYRFHTWGAFINRLLEALRERIQHEVSHPKFQHG